jgi:large repetitive protein
VWGTDSQVIELFSYFDPDVSGSGSAGGLAHFGAAQLFLSAFQPTQSFCITYACGAFAAGWTASKDEADLPIVGSVGWGTTPVSINGSFNVGPTANADEQGNARGVWLWRATGPGPRAYNDNGRVASPAGGVAVASVLVNDWIAGSRATPDNVTIAQSSSANSGVTLDISDGSVDVGPATPAGTYTLSYRMCDIADASACDDATVTVVVDPYVVDAVNDSGWASPSTGGTAIANVLANDTLTGTLATMSNVSLSLVSVSPASSGVTLDLADGSVDVARGTTLGNYAVVYKICDNTSLSNCDQATASIAVRNYVIDAVNESVRASSKTGGTVIASVLANDTLNGARATTATVQLSQVSPAIPGITLSLSSGAVSVAPKTNSGLYNLVYKICEIASPNNCDSATVALDLSGGGGGH